MVSLTGLILTLIAPLLCLSVFGFVYTPKTNPGFINPRPRDPNPVCSNWAVECKTNGDCAECIDNDVFEIRCQETGIKRKKYCTPKIPDKPCNEDLGGVWVWTGWSSTRTREWECLCAYPEIAGNKGCTKLNPNVCKGGTYGYSAKRSNRGPVPSDCVCSKGSVRITSDNNVPMCIPENPGFCPDERTCRSFYSSL